MKYKKEVLILLTVVVLFGFAYFKTDRVDKRIDGLVVQGSDDILLGASTLFAQNASVQLNLEVMGSYASTSGNISFNGEIMPDGATCSNDEILKKTGSNNWDCAADNTSSAFSLEVGTESAFAHVTSISFMDSMFSVSNTGSQSFVRLDWGAGGPASLSEAETITGNWVNTTNPWADNEVIDGLTVNGGTIGNNTLSAGATFTGSASISANLEIVGYASASQYFGAGINGAGDCNDSGEAVNWTTTGLFGCNASLQPLDATLTALAAYNTNGLLTQTAADTFTGRTITGTTNQITLVDGNGVAGNPTISVPSVFIFPGQASVSTNFEVATNASGSALFGFGLNAMTGTTGCSGATDTLNYDASTGKFSCGSDATGSVASDSLGFGALIDPLVLDENASVSFGAFNWEFNLNSTGDFSISDNDVNWWTFHDTSGASNSRNFELVGYASLSNIFFVNTGTAGRVGINDTTPSQRFSIVGNVGETTRFSVEGGTTFMSFGADSTDGPFYMWNNADGEALRFATADDTDGNNFSEKARFDTNGQFGIGKTPTTKLDVSGSASVSLTFEAGNIIDNGTLNVTGLSTLGAITATGVVDFGGATSFEVPNGAGGTTVNAAGEVGIDTSSESFNYYSGTREVPLGPYDKCVSKQFLSGDLTSYDQRTIFIADEPYTLAMVQYTASGSNAFGFNLRVGSLTVPTTSVFTVNRSASGSTPQKWTAFASSALVDGSKLDYKVTSTSATLDSVYVRACFFKTP